MRQQDLETLVIELAQPIDRHLNPGPAPLPQSARTIGFLLCAFEFGERGGGLAYVSNATKESLTPALQELLAKLAETGVIVSIPRNES